MKDSAEDVLIIGAVATPWHRPFRPNHRMRGYTGSLRSIRLLIMLDGGIHGSARSSPFEYALPIIITCALHDCASWTVVSVHYAARFIPSPTGRPWPVITNHSSRRRLGERHRRPTDVDDGAGLDLTWAQLLARASIHIRIHVIFVTSVISSFFFFFVARPRGCNAG